MTHTNNSLKMILNQKGVAVRFLVAATLALMSWYAYYLSSISRDEHANLGHSWMTMDWAREMWFISFVCIILTVTILVFNFRKYGHIVAIVSFVLISSSTDMLKRSVNLMSIDTLEETEYSYRLSAIRAKSNNFLPSRSFTMSPSERNAANFRNTIEEVEPKLRYVTEETIKYLTETAKKAVQDPRFSWYFTGTPPTQATVNAYQKAIIDLSNKGKK